MAVQQTGTVLWRPYKVSDMAGNSPVRQVGPVTPGHLAVWNADGDLVDGPPVSDITGPGGTGYSQPAFHGESANPTDTNSTVYVMMGLGVEFTPANNSRGIFTVDGQMGCSANNAQVFVTLVAGTGAAPPNGRPLAATNGSTVGQPAQMQTARAGDYAPFSQTTLVPGLTAGTPYWVDVAVRVTGGTSILSELEITGFVLVDVGDVGRGQRGG